MEGWMMMMMKRRSKKRMNFASAFALITRSVETFFFFGRKNKSVSSEHTQPSGTGTEENRAELSVCVSLKYLCEPKKDFFVFCSRRVGDWDWVCECNTAIPN